MKSLRTLSRDETGPAPRASPAYSQDLQELWFSLMRRPWASLTFVPAHESGSAVALAYALATIGGRFRGAPIAVLEGLHLDLETAARLTLDVQTAGEQRPTASAPRTGPQAEQRRFIVLSSVLGDPMGIPVALASDGVVLVVDRFVATRASADRTLQAIGRDHVLGAVLVG